MGYLPVTLCGPRTTVIVWRVLVVLGSLLFLLLQLLQFSQAVCPLLRGKSSRSIIHPGLDSSPDESVREGADNTHRGMKC